MSGGVRPGEGPPLPFAPPGGGPFAGACGGGGGRAGGRRGGGTGVKVEGKGLMWGTVGAG